MAPQDIIAEALAGLVHQFADAMACFRELVQNAVDAGSAEIDISFDYRDGRLIIQFDDYGQGMDRVTIDTKLTRLFSSAKEDDRTKIGRFGIGFVSVFALDPEVICIDTSHAGEHWRVVFRPDRSFTRVQRDNPVDGTKISIYKSMPRREARAFITRATQAIIHWCRYVPAEIRIDGVGISRPFALDLACTVSAHVGESRILVGYSHDTTSNIGYYNGGLTLREESPGPFSGVHAKIWSPLLEHTMTRDNVLRDEGYARVLAHTQAQVEGPLRDRLMTVLAELAQTTTVHRRGDAYDVLVVHLAQLVASDARLRRDVFTIPLVRCHHAGLVDLRTLRRASQRDRVYWSAAPSALTELVHARGDLVIAAEPGGLGEIQPPHVCWLSRALGGRDCMYLHQELFTTLPAADHPGMAKLRPLLVDLLRSAGLRPRSIDLGDMHYPGAKLDAWVAVGQASVGEVTAYNQRSAYRDRHVVLNARHPSVQQALTLANEEPELAAYLLTKVMVLAGGAGLPVSTDQTLATEAMGQRWQRKT